MSKDINKVELSGELGWDPNISYTSKGTPHTTTLLVVNDGEYNGKAINHRIRLAFWDDRAEQFVNQGYQKGDRIKVKGKIRVNRWKVGDEWMERVEVVVSEWEGEASGGSQAIGEEVVPGSDDDVPF